jgi:DNA polymerase V
MLKCTTLTFLPPSFELKIALPLASFHVSAGFPSPADDYLEGSLDLNEYFIRHPAATFYVRASGDSMRGAGIFDGDLLIVDRAVACPDGAIAERTGNAQAPDDRNWLKIQALELRVQTIRSVSARFALHVLFAPR